MAQIAAPMATGMTVPHSERRTAERSEAPDCAATGPAKRMAVSSAIADRIPVSRRGAATVAPRPASVKTHLRLREGLHNLPPK